MTTALAKTGPIGRTQLVTYSGDDGKPLQSIVKTTARGEVHSMLTRVPLSKDAGEVYDMKAGWDNAKKQAIVKRTITAMGYMKLNAFAGVTFITPETLMTDDGRVAPNPYMHRDKNGDTEYVRVRKIGIGRSATGNWMAVDYTLTFNLRTYFAIDLMSKWTGRKSDAVAEWGQLFARGEAMTNVFPRQKLYDLPNGVSLVVDLTHKDVIGLLNEQFSRHKFAERQAITICERNILKRFIPVTVLPPNGSVPVVSWPQMDRDYQTLQQMAADAQQGRVAIDDAIIDVTPVEQVIGDKEEDLEDINAAMEGEYDGEDARERGDQYDDDPTPGMSPQQAPQQTNAPSDSAMRLQAEVRDLIAQLGKDSDAVVEVLLTYKLGSVAAIAECDDAKMLGDIKLELVQAKSKKAAAAAPPRQPEGQGLIPGDAPPSPQSRPRAARDASRFTR